MEYIRSKVANFEGEITFNTLKNFINSIDINDIDYKSSITEPLEAGDYGRNIITLEPFECVLISWPAGVESAVHHHKGLFGYVWVLEGELDNIFYKEEDGNLVENTIDKYGRNGLIPEPDGVIHKLANQSTHNKRAVSLHFYHPAIHSFEGMRIFNLYEGHEGILSDAATTASWQETPGHFKEIKKNVFQYVSFDQLNKNKSHIISNVIPKPATERINEMNSDYFCEQAEQYDFSDFNQPNRKSYTEAIDELIAEDLKKHQKTKKHLDIAIGTGRRAINIKEKSGMNYEIVGVDISEDMCKIAESRGIRTYHQDWANDDTHTGELFDSISFLYAFGHLGDKTARLKTLKKVNAYLVSNGVFYFDLFSINNQNEWGPLALKEFEEKKLSQYGYEKGDVFYRKNGMSEIAFLHYFDQDEITALLNQTGFEVEWVKFVGYAQNPGEVVNSDYNGSMFIKAVKKS